MTTAVETRRFLASTAQREQRHRKIEFAWKVGTKTDDFDGERDIMAVLSISHHKAGANYFSGEVTTEDHFDVSLGNETWGSRASGATVRGFTLFSAVGIARFSAGNRYSEKKLREAADAGYARFRELVEEGDERVLRYLQDGGYKA